MCFLELWQKVQMEYVRKGAGVNEFLYMLVCNDLADGTSRMAGKKRGFSTEQEQFTLEKVI